jgi:hypothetical protein
MRAATRRRLRHLVPLVMAVTCGTVFLPGHAVSAAPSADAPIFRPAVAGCAMAHCDAVLSDQARVNAPAGPVAVRWTDPTAAGSMDGLGCVANGIVAACTFGGTGTTGPYLRVYTPGGKVLWTSRDILNATSNYSAPLINGSSEVIAADDTRVVRFATNGSVVWNSPTPGGVPISPVVTANGAVVLATFGGPISAYSSSTGALIETLDLTTTIDGQTGRFETANTPAVRDNRIYVLTEFRLPGPNGGTPDPLRRGRMYAIDLDPTKAAGQRLSVAWYFEVGARSASSPLLFGDILFFDAGSLNPGTDPVRPLFLALRDMGGSGKLLWTYPMGSQAIASAAKDPRGGIWIYARNVPRLVRLSEYTGKLLQEIDTDAILNLPGAHFPSSAMTIAGRPADGQPVMLVTLTSVTEGAQSTYVTAIDLVGGTLMWKQIIGTVKGANVPGQFPIAFLGSTPVIIASTSSKGVVAISTAP